MKIIAFFFLLLLLIPREAAPDGYLSQAILAEQIERAVLDKIPQKVRVELKGLRISKKIPPQADLILLSPQPPLGLINFQYRWREKDKIRRALGNVVVKCFAEVAVSKRMLRHGEILNAENITSTERELGLSLNTGYFLDREKVYGLLANGYIKAGGIIKVSNTKRPHLVKRGQILDLVHKNGQLKITARTRVLMNGRVGDWIRVQNIDNKAILHARVSDDGNLYLR